MNLNAQIKWLESIERINRLYEPYERMQSVLNILTPDFLQQADRMQQTLTAMQPLLPGIERSLETAQRLEAALGATQPLISAIEGNIQLAQRLESIANLSAKIEASVDLSARLDAILFPTLGAVERLFEIVEPSCLDISFDEEIGRALTGIEPILNLCVDDGGEAAVVCADAIETVRHKGPLSIETIIGLISILLAIAALLMDAAPDPQLKQIAEQQDIMIAQNEVRLRLEDEKLAQVQRNEQTCLALLQAVDTLAEKVDALTERLADQQAAGTGDAVLDSNTAPDVVATPARD